MTPGCAPLSGTGAPNLDSVISTMCVYLLNYIEQFTRTHCPSMSERSTSCCCVLISLPGCLRSERSSKVQQCFGLTLIVSLPGSASCWQINTHSLLLFHTQTTTALTPINADISTNTVCRCVCELCVCIRVRYHIRK